MLDIPPICNDVVRLSHPSDPKSSQKMLQYSKNLPMYLDDFPEKVDNIYLFFYLSRESNFVKHFDYVKQNIFV